MEGNVGSHRNEIMPQKGTKGTNAFDVEAHQIAAYRAF
jgi:hypothetical protein